MWVKTIHKEQMFENFGKFLSSERNKERVIAIVAVGIGIVVLNKMGLYGEQGSKTSTPPTSSSQKKKA